MTGEEAWTEYNALIQKARTRMLDRPITEDPLKVRLALEISRVLPRLAGEAEPDSVPERPD
jgi:hypothetical protein